MSAPERDSGEHRHGNVFDRGSGNMFIHVQRESGLAHRTLVLRPWQVQALRLVASRWFAIVLMMALLSWGYFALQTARVPFLTRRITHLELDAAKLDTLQAALELVQKRYDQVQQMLSASKRAEPAAATPASKPNSTSAKPASTAASAITKAASKPGSTAAKRAAAPQPVATKPTVKPGSTTVKPAVKPGSTTVKPAVKPGSTTVKPAVKPGSTAVKPPRTGSTASD